MTLSPYEQGRSAFDMGRAAPRFPTPHSSWAERLYNRGWTDRRDEQGRGNG